MSDRKYRQRGYQDSEPRRAQKPSPMPGPKPEGPRGRGLGAPTTEVFRCSHCGDRVAFLDDLPPESKCGKCGEDLHTCSNCRHFDPASPNECREPVAARVVKKTKRNECELFAAKRTVEFDQEKREGSDPRSAFDALFKR
jgi:hypothetical protein